jgi:hypothetical protein
MAALTHKPNRWKNRIVGFVACLLIAPAGCALFEEEEVIYLKKALKAHATEAEIKRRLRVPKDSQSLPNGELLWKYQIWTNTGGDLNGPGQSYCDQYNLRFDRQGTLRDWTHEDC